MNQSELPPSVKALLQPQFYPHETTGIKLLQTQMSYIFLTGSYAYKIKKAVNLGYLDYTNLEKRHFFCNQELQLNRRLCLDAYLDVVQIKKSSDGIHLGGQGTTIEFALKMKQLPHDRMMDTLILNGHITKNMINTLATKLVDFHHSAKTDQQISSFGKLDIINKNNEENFTQTVKYIGVTISASQYEHIKQYMTDFIDGSSNLFETRIRNDRIKDCHGDLHAAHVCFTDSLCIYDCIEFNDRFRYSDVASEIAFLAMDLDRYQREDLSDHFVHRYLDLSHDSNLTRLLNFYKGYRAFVRGKVESFKLDDPHIDEKEKIEIKKIARQYFNLAESYTR